IARGRYRRQQAEQQRQASANANVTKAATNTSLQDPADELRRAAKRLGVALIAPNGRANSWSFPQGVKRGRARDEFRYFNDLLSDVTSRFPIDPNKIVVSGFSIGASMTWNLACREPGKYAGYVPVAGTLWRPQPQRCRRPIGDLHHYHGTSDRIFPLEGRRVAGKRQGDIRDTFEILYRQDGCTRQVVRETRERGLRCKVHRTCGGKALRFCLHRGAHTVKASYLEDGFRRIARAKGW
ncbi:MAG: hypothetical protein AAFW47_07305, partial [Pseudomonadota bacterium]